MAAESDAIRTGSFPHAFVGREGELGELRRALDDARGGRGGLFLIVGDAGIGKTRLAEEASSAASRQGALVVWGRCWEGGGAPAFWPWVQVFRTLANALENDTLRQALGDAAAAVASLAPEIAASAGTRTPPAHVAAVESEHERFPLFDAVTGFLKRVAAQRPLVLVLDDLHAADEPSLLLLEFLGRELRAAPLVVIGTCREVEAARHPERARALNGVARCGHRLPLGGLSQEQVVRIVSAAVPVDAPLVAPLATRVFQVTEGNPFFIDEVVRLLRAEPHRASTPELIIPPGIREAVREQLRPLSEPCRRLAAAAAVIGREFELSQLQELASDLDLDGGGVESLLDVLGEAESAGVVVRQAGTLARYAFGHALIRETLYDDLAPAQRARLHWRMGELRERQIGSRPDGGGLALAEIAHHYLRGAAVGDARKAVDFAARAGQRAASLLAYEEAAACYQQALEALNLCRTGERGTSAGVLEEQKVELLLDLGEVQARAWNTTSAQETFQQAAELARELRAGHGDEAGTWLARAALGFGRTGIGVPRGHLADPALVRLLEEALAALGDRHPALRARALARLAVELYFSDSAARRAAMCEEASQLARASGDVSTIAYVVNAQHFASWDSPDVDWRLGIANEGVELARRAGEPDLELVSRLWRTLDLLEKGEVRSWVVELDEVDRLAAAMRQPRQISFGATLRAMRALWLGRWDEVEQHWKAGLAAAERVQDRAQTINVALQNFAVQRALGRQADLVPGVEASLLALPGEPIVRCMRAILHADLGHRDEARQDFERLAEGDFSTLRRNNVLSTATLPWLSEVCAFLRDVPRAALLYEFLQPYAAQNIVGGPRIFFGPAAYWLGLLAATLGRLDEAIAHFEGALERARAMDGAPATATIRFALADILRQRDSPGDRERARELLAAARATAAEFRLADLGARAERLAEEIERTPERERVRAAAEGGRSAFSAEAGASSRAPAPGARVLRFPEQRPRPAGDATPAAAKRPEYVFRREGEFWTVSDGSTVLRLKDTKGLRYIALLLRHPDREFHVIDLVAPERGEGAEPGAGLGRVSEKQLNRLGMHTAVDAETGDRLLDAQARAAYQRRLRDLREDLDEATRFNDLERASRAREEMDFLARELARAVGLGGRARAGASGAERARLNVTRAIKAVLRRVAAGSSNLGRYLETTIRTGTFCSYRPDPRLKVSWKL